MFLSASLTDFVVKRFHWIYRLYLRRAALQRLVAAVVPLIERCLPQSNYEGRLRRALLMTLAIDDDGADERVGDRVMLVNVGLANGGAERQIVYTLAGLKASGFHDVTLLLTLPDDGNRGFHLSEVAALGLEVTGLRPATADEPPSADARRAAAETAFLAALPPKLAASVAALRREFAMRHPAVVHAWQDGTSIAAGFAGLLAGVPRILLGSRSLNPQKFLFWRPFLRPCYRVLAGFPAIHFTNNSEAGAADYARWLGLPVAKIRVIRNGFEPGPHLARPSADEIAAFRRQLGMAPEAPLVGSVFRLNPEKRPWLWLRMAATLSRRRPDVHFLLVGSGPMKAATEALARRLRLGDRFHLLPANTAIGLPLSAMDVFVLTSRVEGTPNVVIEAQCLGVPVVATDAGGTAAAVDEGATGWIDRSDRPQALAALVDHVLSSPQLRAVARRRGPEFVKARFSLSRMIDETIALYGLPAAAALEGQASVPSRHP